MQFKGPTEAVRHVAAIHPKRQIAVLISRGDKKIKPRTYSIKGEDIDTANKIISVDSKTEKIQIQNKNETDSPIHKMTRVNTPTKHVHKQLFSAFEHSITSSEKNVHGKGIQY
jgi:hypothetical protein